MRFIAVVCGLAVGMVSVAGAEPVMDETITSDALLSGEANERLQDIGRRAVEQDLVLQVNAPDIWESEILTPVRQGAGDTRLEVKFVNTMSDTVTIRGVEASEAEDPRETLKRITNNAKARSVTEEMDRDEKTGQGESTIASRNTRSKKSSRSRPDIDKPDTHVPEVRVERPSPDMLQSNPINSARDLYDDGMVRQSVGRPQPEVDEPGPVSTPDDDAEQAEAATSTDNADAAAKERHRLEGLYNDGRAIRRTLSADELKRKDLIYSGNHHNLVVRKGITRKTFWLEGDLPENRIEQQEGNRYVVTESKEKE